MKTAHFLQSAFAGLLLLFASLVRAETVSLVLIDGDIRQGWPSNGVVAFHRETTDVPLTINFTLGGNAIAGTDYTVANNATITIPAGDREAWLEFVPSGNTMSKAVKSIVVTLAESADYELSKSKSERTASLLLTNHSTKPCAKSAIRFLNQAAFGPNANFANVTEVMRRGFDKWITDQIKRPVGLQQPYLSALDKRLKDGVSSEMKMLSWWRRAMSTADNADPLRQRVGFALSEIMVISDHVDDLQNNPVGMLNYYDALLKNAFGNFRTLLFDVATHPCMGIYLNHLGNEKGDPEAGTFADENFAREIMQLFAIGLWQLNDDGTLKLDGNNKPIPNYGNTEIEGMAKVMTGFGFGGPKANNFYDAPENFTAPMRMWDEFHDLTEKHLLNGLTLPARTVSDPDTGAAGMADFNVAIDMLFNHPSCPPFISKQLIQKLVTSNPSPAYVGRVTAIFKNNGSGVRGDLAAVVRAILLDSEARDMQVAAQATSGKMKEPYLRTVNLARAFNAKAANGQFDLGRNLEEVHFQQPLSSPTVFNFFKPGYTPAGPVNDAGLVAPEFQILNAVTATSVPNFYYFAIENGLNRYYVDHEKEVVKLHFEKEIALAHDVPALLRRLDLLLTGGTLPNEQHQLIRETVQAMSNTNRGWRSERVRMAVYLISTSPEFGILR